MLTISFIINRYSGTDRLKEMQGKVERYLDLQKFDFTIAYTEYQGHGTALAREAAMKGVHAVVAVGGDGSVNEVARGIIGTGAMLGIIPKGSGNGLARSLGIPRTTEGALKLLNRNMTRRIDIGYANGHLFLSNAGVGFDALIAKRFAESKSRGLIHYARLIAKSVRRYLPAEYSITIDGKRYRQEAFFINVANANQMGYDFKISPDALLDDGILDVCLMKPLNLVALGRVSIQSLQGHYGNNSRVRHLRGKTIEISSDQLEWMQLDGDAMELVERNRVTIHLKPRGLSVICQAKQSKPITR